MQYNTHDDSFGPAKSARAPAGAAMPIKTQVGDSFTVDYGPNGEMKQSTSSGISHQTSKAAPTNKGILATARTAQNGAVTGHALNPNDTVAIGNMRTSVASAEQNGWLVRNADGSYSEPGQNKAPFPEAASADDSTADQQGGEDRAQKAAQSDQSGPEEFTLGDEGEKLLSEIVSTYDAATTNRAMDEAIMRGEFSDRTLSALAQKSGEDPAAVAEKLGKAYEAFYDSAMDRFAARGVIDEDALSAFVSDNPRFHEIAQRGARELATSNKTALLDSIADAFIEQADRYIPNDVKAALDQAGIPYRDNGKGGLIIKLGKTEMSYSVAVKTGEIRPEGYTPN